MTYNRRHVCTAQFLGEGYLHGENSSLENGKIFVIAEAKQGHLIKRVYFKETQELIAVSHSETNDWRP